MANIVRKFAFSNPSLKTSFLIKYSSRTWSQLRNNRNINTQENENETHFGYQRVKIEEKEEKVRQVFDNVASRYDIMNDLMSGGTHRLFKDYLMYTLDPLPGTKLIDVAGGTGDIAFRFLKAIENKEKENLNIEKVPIIEPGYEPQQSHVTVCDINCNMLKVGEKRAEELGYIEGISWVEGNAEKLPFEENQFDAYTIAFGIRNVTRKEAALDEAYRVLKPGGRFLCLEFSHVENRLFSQVYDWYSFQIIPVLGQLVARDWNSYQYLVESIRLFPNQEEFKLMIEEAGFSETRYTNILNGIVAIHSGYKL